MQKTNDNENKKPIHVYCCPTVTGDFFASGADEPADRNALARTLASKSYRCLPCTWGLLSMQEAIAHALRASRKAGQDISQASSRKDGQPTARQGEQQTGRLP
mmetsp:Transcript_74931/g.156217  ORF Transcript_74931/g.156217 Transcript_74931/m.156217 type:complete len:103 (+) Transcript_74931:287-595(+)